MGRIFDAIIDANFGQNMDEIFQPKMNFATETSSQQFLFSDRLTFACSYIQVVGNIFDGITYAHFPQNEDEIFQPNWNFATETCSQQSFLFSDRLTFGCSYIQVVGNIFDGITSAHFPQNEDDFFLTQNEILQQRHAVSNYSYFQIGLHWDVLIFKWWVVFLMALLMHILLKMEMNLSNSKWNFATETCSQLGIAFFKLGIADASYLTFIGAEEKVEACN